MAVIEMVVDHIWRVVIVSPIAISRLPIVQEARRLIHVHLHLILTPYGQLVT